MSQDTNDKLYAIAIDLQKQLGTLSIETAKQSATLISIDEHVKRTNGRVTKLEELNRIVEKEKEYVRGKMAVIGVIAGGLGTFLVTFINKLIQKL